MVIIMDNNQRPDLVIFTPKSGGKMLHDIPDWCVIDIRIGSSNFDDASAPAALICAGFVKPQIAAICARMPIGIPVFLQGENGFLLEVVTLGNTPVFVHPLGDDSKYFRGDYCYRVEDLISILLEAPHA
jgi:hypothetical protein